MKISRGLHREIENFFRIYYADDKLRLPEAEIYVRRGAEIFSKIGGFQAITLGRFIFIKPSIVCRDLNSPLKIPKTLLVHELTHAIQYQKQGFFGFLLSYLKAYYLNLRRKKKWDIQSRTESYLEIPHEIEARDAAEKFVEWFYRKKNYSSSVSNSK